MSESQDEVPAPVPDIVAKKEASFVFATCKPGWETVVKAAQPELRPAFMRPGLLTWKSEHTPPEDVALRSIFVRVTGHSIGRCTNDAELAEKVKARALGQETITLHLYPREVPENGFSVEEWGRLDLRRKQCLEALRSAGLEVREEERPASGGAVLDVILEDEEGAPFFVGWHRHGARSHSVAGGIPRAVLPPEAPSRAWLKLVQALSFAGIEEGELSGRVALELGSAPGGSSYALLQRGVRVFGVDPAPMDERVTLFAGPDEASFVHLKMPVGDVPPALLPTQVDLLVSDLNLAPAVVLRLVRKLQARVQAPLLILTLKINDNAVLAHLSESIAAIRDFAPGPVRVTQLPGNRDEVCVVAGGL